MYIFFFYLKVGINLYPQTKLVLLLIINVHCVQCTYIKAHETHSISVITELICCNF